VVLAKRIQDRGDSMKSSPRAQILAVFVFVLCGITAALAQDKEAVLKNRETLMKGQAKDLGSVKSYTEGKADIGQAEASAANLTQSTKKIPEVFPPGTGGADSEGKFAAKPTIWTDWNKFLDLQKTAENKADELLAAVKSGNKAAIETAFADLGKNGCGACHETFREKLKD
jgi:cytochrome c556